MTDEEMVNYLKQKGYVITKTLSTGNSEAFNRGTVLDKISCPKCGHFAAFKLDSEHRVTYNEALSHRCAIRACGHEF